MKDFSVNDVLKQEIGKEPIKISDELDLWLDWYKGYVEKFHKYKIYNGKNYTVKTKKRLNLAKLSCETWANYLINEKTLVNLETKEDDAKLNNIFEDTGFWHTANEGIEKTFALGTGALLISVVDVTKNVVTGNIVKNDGTIKIEFINACNIHPLAIEYGEVTECAFSSIGTYDATITIIHKNELGNYENIALVYRKVDGGDFQLLERIVTQLGKTKWFTLLKPNIANNFDISSPFGISVYANAIDQLMNADNIYDSYDNEITYSRRRIFVSSKMINVSYNNETNETEYAYPFDDNDMSVYVLPESDDGKTMIQSSVDPIRSADYEKAINGALSIFSTMTGFGKGYFIFNNEGGGRPVQTATGIIAQNSELYTHIRKHEVLIEKALREFVQAICEASQFTPTPISKIYAKKDVKIKFDDSIIEDKESEKESARKDVALGTMSEVEYRVKFENEEESVALDELRKNPTYIAKQLNLYLPSLQAKVISPDLFVDLVFGEGYTKRNETIAYIQENMSKGINAEDLMNNGFGFGA